MGLFDQFFKRNKNDPLSETSVGELFCDYEKYTGMKRAYLTITAREPTRGSITIASIQAMSS